MERNPHGSLLVERNPHGSLLVEDLMPLALFSNRLRTIIELFWNRNIL